MYKDHMALNVVYRKQRLPSSNVKKNPPADACLCTQDLSKMISKPSDVEIDVILEETAHYFRIKSITERKQKR